METNFGKVLIALLLLAVGLAGLGMTLCGGAFSFMAGEAPAILLISLPSLGLGLLLVYVAVKRLRKLFGTPT